LQQAADRQGRHQPAGSFKALAHPLLHVGAEQQGLAGPGLQLAAAQGQLLGAAPEQDHATNAALEQPPEVVVGQFPAGIAPLAIAGVAAGAQHQQARHLLAQG
jgi:hypothetical protein